MRGLVEAGGCWAIPGVETHWIRPLDGARIRVRTGEARPAYRARGKGALVHSLGGTSRTVASLVRAAIPGARFLGEEGGRLRWSLPDEGPEPVCFRPLTPKPERG